MKKFISLSIAASLTASVFMLATSAQAADPSSTTARVAGEKMDSGLGDLPHYSKWADPTGKNPLQARTASDTKQGDAPAVRDAKPMQPAAMQVSQAK